MNSQPGGMPPCQVRPQRKRHAVRNIVTGLAAVIVVIIAVSVATAGKSPSRPAASTATTAPVAATTQPDTTVTQPASPAAPQYTAAQSQALMAAIGYITDGQGFSRAGLIKQLHSPYGNGFALKDAKWAVNHLHANWKRQAVIAAKGYMSDGEGFSWSGLVQQMDSPYGSQFTVAQAEYAAKAVGL